MLSLPLQDYLAALSLGHAMAGTARLPALKGVANNFSLLRSGYAATDLSFLGRGD